MTKQELKDYGVKVSQASRTGLIVIMYDIAIKYLDDAIKAYEGSDTAGYREYLKKGKNIINELSSALDMKYPVSSGLFGIYTFMNNALVRADIRNDASEVVRIKDMLVRLRMSFETVSRTDDSGPVMENSQQVYAGLTYSRSSLNEDVYNNDRRGFTV